jgi:regulator of nonsense transcripts 2
MDIEFLILDTYELVNPKWKMAKTYTEAAELVNSFVDNKVISHAEISAQDDDESDDEDEDEEDMTEIISQTQDFQVVDDERPVNALTIEPDLDFEKEFSQLLIDGLDTRKMEKRPQAFDVSVPMRSKTTDMHSDSGGIVNFTVMMKKGSKAQVYTILNIYVLNTDN